MCVSFSSLLSHSCVVQFRIGNRGYEEDGSLQWFVPDLSCTMDAKTYSRLYVKYKLFDMLYVIGYGNVLHENMSRMKHAPFATKDDLYEGLSPTLVSQRALVPQDLHTETEMFVDSNCHCVLIIASRPMGL